jgi:hypothetical protein
MDNTLLLTLFLNYVAPVVGTAIGGGIMYLIQAAKTKFNVDTEVVWRAALDQALHTAAQHAAATGSPVDQAILDMVNYVKASVPEAVAGLKGSDIVLAKKAAVALQNAVKLVPKK